MSIPTDPKDGLNDDDIQSLFNSENSAPPQAMDQAILSAAKEAVSTKQETKTNLKLNDAKRWYSYWPQGLSAAAVLVLAVLLVPLIVSTPDSSLESSLADNQEVELASRAPELSSNDGLVQQKSSAQPTGAIARTTNAARSSDVVESASDIQTDVTLERSFDSQLTLVSLLNGSSYKSDGGQGWRLTFDSNRFTWTHRNRADSGTYEFVTNNVFRAKLPDKQLTIKLSNEALVWDGVNYLAE